MGCQIEFKTIIYIKQIVSSTLHNLLSAGPKPLKGLNLAQRGQNWTNRIKPFPQYKTWLKRQNSLQLENDTKPSSATKFEFFSFNWHWIWLRSQKQAWLRHFVRKIRKTAFCKNPFYYSHLWYWSSRQVVLKEGNTIWGRLAEVIHQWICFHYKHIFKIPFQIVIHNWLSTHECFMYLESKYKWTTTTIFRVCEEKNMALD